MIEKLHFQKIFDVHDLKYALSKKYTPQQVRMWEDRVLIRQEVSNGKVVYLPEEDDLAHNYKNHSDYDLIKEITKYAEELTEKNASIKYWW